MSPTAATSAAIDPTALSLLSIFGGVVVTVIAGFLGAWIQGRREHSRWVREKRFAAYVDLLELTGELERSLRVLEEVSSRREKLHGSLLDVRARVADDTDPDRQERGMREWERIEAEIETLTATEAGSTEHIHASKATIVKRMVSFTLLGPQTVTTAGAAVLHAGMKSAMSMNQHRWLLEKEMRTALSVKY